MTFFELLAQPVYIDFDQIGLAVEVAIPNMLDDFAASDELGGAQQQELEEREFFGSERNDLLTPSGAAPVPPSLIESYARLGFEVEERRTVDDPAIAEWESLGRPGSPSFGAMTLNGLDEQEIREFFVVQWLVRSRSAVRPRPGPPRRR